LPGTGPPDRPGELFTPLLRGAAATWLLLVVILGTALRDHLGDPDLWWHLKTGAIIAATGQVPRTDPFSYSAGGKPWTAHEWLAALILYGAWRAGGWGGILWFRGLMIAATTATLYLVLRRRSGSWLAAILLAFSAALATSSFWTERPHLFTFLFFAILVGILNTAAEGRPRPLWAVPPLVLLWANVHGGYASAFILMATFSVGLWLDGRGVGDSPRAGEPERPSAATAAVGAAAGGARPPAKAGARAVSPRRLRGLTARAPVHGSLVRRLLLVGVLSLFAACVNPQGPALLLYPFRYLAEGGLTNFVSEWQVPNVKTPLGRLFEVLLLAVLALALGARARLPWRDVLPTLVFAHLALTAVRHVPLFAMVAANLLAGVWQSAAPELLRRARAWPPAGRFWAQVEREQRAAPAGTETAGTRLVSAGLVLFGLVLCWRMTPRDTRFRSLVPARDVPVAAGRWLQENAPPGRVFNHYDFGGYLIYLPRRGQAVDAAPNPWKVVIDGRADLYGGAVMRRFFSEATNAGPGWQELLDGKYRADLVFWSPRSPLAQVLAERPEWEKVYPPPGSPDQRVVIFRRRVQPAPRPVRPPPEAGRPVSP
jgi:hypothetical protein